VIHGADGKVSHILRNSLIVPLPSFTLSYEPSFMICTLLKSQSLFFGFLSGINSNSCLNCAI
jgi:hypothetical protein